MIKLENTKVAVVRTAFHGGGIESKHLSIDAGLKAYLKNATKRNCDCGCVGIVVKNKEVEKELKEIAKDMLNETKGSIKYNLLSNIVYQDVLKYDEVSKYNTNMIYYELCF